MGFFDIFRRKKIMTLEEVVKKMKRDGYSHEEIKEKLMGEVSEKFLRGIGVSNKKIEEIMKDVEKDKDKLPTSDDVRYKWILEKCDIDDDTRDYITTEQGKNFINKDGVCEDCLDRKDRVGTMEYFKLIGLPQSGFSMCQQGCGCRLEKED